jgi:hypothetical protein
VGWTVFIAIVGLITTAAAGPITEWWRRGTERRWIRRDERKTAAVELLDAYTRWGNYLLHDVTTAPAAARAQTVAAGKAVLESFNVALHRAQLLFRNEGVVDELDEIATRVGSWFQSAVSGTIPASDQLDVLHRDLLRMLRRELKE